MNETPVERQEPTPLLLCGCNDVRIVGVDAELLSQYQRLIQFYDEITQRNPLVNGECLLGWRYVAGNGEGSTRGPEPMCPTPELAGEPAF
jgi:hypothetical protein